MLLLLLPIIVIIVWGLSVSYFNKKQRYENRKKSIEEQNNKIKNIHVGDIVAVWTDWEGHWLPHRITKVDLGSVNWDARNDKAPILKGVPAFGEAIEEDLPLSHGSVEVLTGEKKQKALFDAELRMYRNIEENQARSQSEKEKEMKEEKELEEYRRKYQV